MVRFLDDSNTGTRRIGFVDVPVGAPVVKAKSSWSWELDADGCEGDSTSLALRATQGGRQLRISDACVWDGLPGVPSPDGKFLAVWRHWDGAAARLHVLALGTEPTDLGEISASLTTSYSAVWTRDGRLWFTADAEAAGQDKLWSVAPPQMTPAPTAVPDAAMVESVTIAD